MDHKIIEEKDSGWSSWKIYVIKSLDYHQSSITKLEDTLHTAKEEQVEMRTKVGIWSAVISAFTSIVIAVIAGLIIYSYTSDAEEKNKNYHNNEYHYTEERESN